MLRNHLFSSLATRSCKAYVSAWLITSLTDLCGCKDLTGDVQRTLKCSSRRESSLTCGANRSRALPRDKY
jgi:hypothetical protein